MKPSWPVICMKRLIDFLAGSAGMLIMALVHPVIVLLIKLESRGPVLYSQERVGINRRARRPQAGPPGGQERRKSDVGGKPFRIWKYRTMRVDAEAAGPQLAQKGLDPRVTRVGKWLRALHIDEVPQFLNVIRGEMSLIGPRPERPHFTRQYTANLPHYSDRTRHIRPGLTGLAQVLLGYDDSLESVVRKTHFDMSYRASFCSLASWLKMEAWIVWYTVTYLLQKPQFEGETRELSVLKRAKQLPFQGRAQALSPVPARTRVAITFGKEARPMVLAGSDPAELSARIDALDFAGRPAPEVIVRAKPHLDLEDVGFLVGLAHKVKQHGGHLELRNAPLAARKILREMRMDSVLGLQHGHQGVRNFLTVDVECWFHAYNMRPVAPKCSWHTLPAGIEGNMEKLLELLRAHEVKATFFVLGWVADRYPEVVRMIDREGHEIGTHGYHHDLITEMTPAVFEDDLLRSLEAISRNTSQRIRGHRASNFSVVSSTLWALEILARHGLQYDSSIFPIARKRYGVPDWANRNPHMLNLAGGRKLIELPMSTMRVAGRQMPVAGGGYLRLYPSQVTERFIAQQNLRGLPAMVYLHPWELDPLQTRRALGLVEGFQHYVNLDTTEWKLNRLLQRFDFGAVSENLKLPRMQSILRRNPVSVPEQVADPGHKAKPAFPHPIETVAVAEAAPHAAEAPSLSTVTWPLHIGPAVDWTPVQGEGETRSAVHGPAGPGREAHRAMAGEESVAERRLSENLETTGREA
jgi:polysaccharide deacetylase family protein (PEP-CTERM system associated)